MPEPGWRRGAFRASTRRASGHWAWCPPGRSSECERLAAAPPPQGRASGCRSRIDGGRAVTGPKLALAAALTLGLSAAGGAAPILDQEQPAIAVGSALNQGNIHWQTFTAGISGRLDSVVVNLWRFCD